jgi:hypothetical protein
MEMPSKYDGLPWNQQPWWRRWLFPVAFVLLVAGLFIWRLLRWRATAADVASTLDDPMNRAQSPEQWAKDKDAIEAVRKAKIDNDVADILGTSSQNIINDFHKRFGKGPQP